MFSTPWDSLPGGKIALALIALAVPAGLMLAIVPDDFWQRLM